MLNYDVFSDHFHGKQFLIERFSHQVNLSKCAPSNNTYKLKVFKCGLNKSVTSIQSAALRPVFKYIVEGEVGVERTFARKSKVMAGV